MTKFDIKNYLEKIYSVPVMEVKTVNRRGKYFLFAGVKHLKMHNPVFA